MIKSELIVEAAHWVERMRKVIVWIVLTLVVAVSLVYFKADLLISILIKPLNGVQLYFLTPAEGFMAKMRVSFLGGLVLASPVILLLILRQTGTKLAKKTKRLLIFLIIPFSFVLFVGGMAFGYRLILPSTIKFLMEVGSGFMTPTLSGDEYFSFVGTLLLCIGLIFELPLILIALSRIGIVTSKMLKGKRKVAIMLSLLTIAVISPALDVFTYLLVTMPILVLYEISIWTIVFLEKRDKRLSHIKNSEAS
ncbi:twin-arginine translocase subunit TatC [Desulfosporosinus sp. BG]|uniref:twin-arginine translocase subunit TatC n=1 Tax=Desulfosporosinus sp. BG TaxID=1633135 RepID=UPI00083B8B17|nr:twin-arginine translocase subunit TatC [Desulfosporosinus sp. BG]ODA39840.1 Twin-arginine translocation protein TatC [Desulfosporosinus sp. BG]